MRPGVYLAGLRAEIRVMFMLSAFIARKLVMIISVYVLRWSVDFMLPAPMSMMVRFGCYRHFVLMWLTVIWCNH